MLVSAFHRVKVFFFADVVDTHGADVPHGSVKLSSAFGIAAQQAFDVVFEEVSLLNFLVRQELHVVVLLKANEPGQN
jgi:hypothetical protein